MPALESCNCQSCQAFRRGDAFLDSPLSDYDAAMAEADAEMDGTPAVRTREYRTCERCGESRPLDTYAARGRGRSRTCNSCREYAVRMRENVALRGRKFGVEIEFLHHDMHEDAYDVDEIGEDLAASLTRESGVQVDWVGYNHTTPRDFKLVTDSSVPNGFELVSPPMFWSQRGKVTALVDALNTLGMEVDSTCGIHVHHEVADLSLGNFKSLVQTWADAQHHTDRLVAPSRRQNAPAAQQWCAPWNVRALQYTLGAESIEQLVGRSSERYLSLNLTCYPSYGTVEIRQHHGTLNAEKILAWIAYGQAMVEFACAGTPVPYAFRAFLDALPISDADECGPGLELEQLTLMPALNATREYLAARSESLSV